MQVRITALTFERLSVVGLLEGRFHRLFLIGQQTKVPEIENEIEAGWLYKLWEAI